MEKKTFLRELQELYMANDLSVEVYSDADDVKQWKVMVVKRNKEVVVFHTFKNDESDFYGTII